MKLNETPTHRTTYYFSYVTETSRPCPLSMTLLRDRLNKEPRWPSPRTHPLMMWLSAVVGSWRHTLPVPYPAWRDEDWWNNDGPVPVHSQKFPIVFNRKVGGARIGVRVRAR